MKLKSFGCSFIFGTDLSDEIIAPGNFASKLTWPALIAKELDLEYECYAKPGSGNLCCLEKIIEQASISTDSDIFVIGWSWIDRFDYFDSNCDPSALPTARDSNDYHIKWKTILPVDNTDESKFYYRNLHSEYKDKLVSLIYIKSAIDILKQKKIPFLMTCMDSLMFDNKWNSNSAILDSQNYVSPYMNYFENQTFLDWSLSKKFPISKTLHPLELAHSVAANIMIPVVRSTLDDK